MGGDCISIYGSMQEPHMDYPTCNNPDMEITQVVAANLSAWMDNHPTLNTLKKISARSGVGFGTVRRAAGREPGNVTIQNLDAIARAFGRNVIDLLADPNATPSAKSNVTVLPAAEPPAAERRLIEGFRVARSEDQETMLFLAERALAAFNERTGNN